MSTLAVGSSRCTLRARVARKRFGGLDNELLEISFRRSRGSSEIYEIIWRPKILSTSLDGLYIFARNSRAPNSRVVMDNVDCNPIGSETVCHEDWPDNIGKIAYIDQFGNVVTGLKSSTFWHSGGLKYGNDRAPLESTF